MCPFSKAISLTVLSSALALFAMPQAASAQAQKSIAGSPPPPATPDASARVAESDRPAIAPYTPQVHYEAANGNETWGGGDKLSLPRLMAAAVVAQDYPAPKMIVEVGSHQGEFLEAFMEKFPAAHGQWTEPVNRNEALARKRLARFGTRVDFVIGCPNRDLALGCIQKGADVLITSWVTSHQELPGLQRFYKNAYAQLPSGGWFASMDHISLTNNAWNSRFNAARLGFEANSQGPGREPGINAPFPTLDEHLAAIKGGGFEEVEVIWRSFSTVMFVAHKR